MKRAAPDGREEKDRQRPRAHDDKVEQKIPQLRLVLIVVEGQHHHPHRHKSRQGDELGQGAETEGPVGEGRGHQPCLGAAAAGEYQLHRFAGCNIQRVQLAQAGKVGQPFGLQRRCRIGDAEGERREILPGGEGEMPLAGSLLPPAIRRDALGGLLGRKDAAAGQLLELCIAPDAGQHDESRQQGGKNENGPFLLHGDASPCGCKKNKVYYSISNRAKKGEG